MPLCLSTWRLDRMQLLTRMAAFIRKGETCKHRKALVIVVAPPFCYCAATMEFSILGHGITYGIGAGLVLPSI